MLHKTLAAETTVTDRELGEFTAIVSAWSPDRVKDTIARTAFDDTIAAWRGAGKHLPLLFEHGQEVVGSIRPNSMRATDAGLVAAGHIDRDAERGEQAWRMIKSGVAGFSIGFLSEDRPRKGGGRELLVIDLLEISVTSKPINAATRATSWKSAADTEQLADLTLEELQAKAKSLGIDELIRTSRPVTIETFEVV